jgi:hypothetical protein
MRVHESHDEGGFVVPNNTISRHAAAYATNAEFVTFLGTVARPAHEVWLPGNDLHDPATWSAPPLYTLKHLHAALLQDYDCTEQPAPDLPALPSGAGGSATANAGAPPPPPPSRSQDTGSGTLVLPQLNRLHEAYKRRQVAPPASSSFQDQQPTASGPIPSQRRHAAAHRTLAPNQDLASEVRWHAVRGAAPAAHASEAHSHGAGFCSPYGDECLGGAS